MLSAVRRAGLVWPTVFALPALVVLICLGAWQWQRLAWKEGLLQRLQKGAVAAPVDVRSLWPVADLDAVRFRRVTLTGHYAHDQEFHVWSPGDKGPAWRIVTPVQLSGSSSSSEGAPTHVLVIRGTVDEAHKVASTRTSGQTAEDITLIGRVRLSAVNWATPAADEAANQWFGLDLDGMRDALGRRDPEAVGRSDGRMIAPFFVEAEKAVAPPPAPQPALRQLSLHNRHFEYALTWWGLSLTLVGVYAAFVVSRLRQTQRL